MATTYDKASLVMIPSGVKESKLYSIKPTSGDGDFTFSRGTDTATRVNASGLIEKERSNQLLQSNSFDTTWIKSNSSVTGGQTGYDGSNDAWLLESSAGGTYRRISQNTNVNSVLTNSIYAKAGNVNYIGVTDTLGSSNNAVFFDLANGVIDSITNAGLIIDAKIEAVGGGWYRCSAALTANASGTSLWFVSATGGSASNAGDNVYIQDAQSEQGLVAQPYIETTTAAVYEGITDNLPRLDYSGGASCPSLLLEPSRTNLINQSEYLNGLPDVSNVVVTTNATTSPEGVVNASKVVASASNTFHWVGVNTSASSGSVYTASVFAKSAEYENLFIVLRTDSGAKRYGVKFNLRLGNIVDDITFGSPTQTNYSIEDYGNGWYRCSVSSYHTSGNIVPLFGPSLGGAVTDINNSFLGDGTSGIYMYGTQAENGAYMTSLIPTYGASASRAADDAKKTGVSDLIGQSEGTLFVDVDFNGYNLSISQTPLFVRTSGANTSYAFINFYLGKVNVGFRIGGSTLFDVLVGSTLSQGRYKIAFAYKSGDLVTYINGSLIDTRTSTFGTTSFADVHLGGVSGNQLGGGHRQALLFKTRLTNAELAALTTI